MKRVLLGLLCLLVLAFSGCTAVNQTNRFAVLPEETVFSTPEATVTLEATAEPPVTQPPQVQLVTELPESPVPTPGATDPPAPTEIPIQTDTPTPQPENGPGGFNG